MFKAKPRTILIDTDTASDDAVALIMALRSPDVHVAAITVVAGNVSVGQGVRNALYTVELCGASTPVHAGAEKPLLRSLEIADWFHGVDGLGDHGYFPVNGESHPTHAVDAIIQCAFDNPGLEVVTLGPLTNLALAVTREPRLASLVGRCVVMGGAPCCEGNVTPAAEFNIWVDPEAASIVFRSGITIQLIGWQLSRFEAVVSTQEIAEILAIEKPVARFAVECNSTAARAYHTQTGEHGIALPDPIAMAVLLDPKLCLDSSYHLVEIETASELSRGMTIVDRLNVSGDERNRQTWALAKTEVQICWKLDVPAWKAALFRALS